MWGERVGRHLRTELLFVRCWADAPLSLRVSWRILERKGCLPRAHNSELRLPSMKAPICLSAVSLVSTVSLPIEMTFVYCSGRFCLLCYRSKRNHFVGLNLKCRAPRVWMKSSGGADSDNCERIGAYSMGWPAISRGRQSRETSNSVRWHGISFKDILVMRLVRWSYEHLIWASKREPGVNPGLPRSGK